MRTNCGPRVILLTAPSGVGKTTACHHFVEAGQREGLSLGGILAPTWHDASGQGAGIDVVDIASGERRALAIVEEDPRRATVGRFRFDACVMRWSLERLLHALDLDHTAVMVDEIGPLELVQRRGYYPALARLSQARASAVILVVRPALEPVLVGELAGHHPVTMTLNAENRDRVPAQLLAAIGGGG